MNLWLVYCLLMRLTRRTLAVRDGRIVIVRLVSRDPLKDAT